jgi:hypothetical protein
MEYRLFGQAQSPGKDFTTDLQSFCDLDDSQREALAIWFETTSDFNTYTPALPPVIADSPLLPEQFRDTAAPIRQILNLSYHHSLGIPDVKRDLLLCGLTSEQIELVTAFVTRLWPIRKRIWVDGLEGSAQTTGLPTIDDMNIIWDARGVFGAPSFYYFDSPPNEALSNQCVGLTNMAILEIMVSDTVGKKERLTIR